MIRAISHVGISLLIVATLTGCFRTRAQMERDREEEEMRVSLRQNVVETSTSMERLQAEIGRLQGRIEELEHRNKKEFSNLSSNMSSSREGSEKTISDLTARLTALQQGQAALFEEMKKLKEENLQLTKALAERPRNAPAAAPQKKSAAGAGASFDSAMKAFAAKDFDEAAEVFRAYLEAHPSGKNSASARYHLGESLYRQKDYESAIVEFGVVHEKSATSGLGRKSTLRIAESFKALGKDKDARAFAQILVQSSPESAEAKRARKLLK